MAEEFLLRPKWLLPVEPTRALEDHALVVRSGLIEALLPAAEAAARHPGLERVELPRHLVIPGLVNARTSAADAADAGLARERARAACAEMLAGGITTFAHVGLFPEAVLGAARQAGLRAACGLAAAAQASAYASDFDDYLRNGLALRDARREDATASFFLALPEAGALSDAQLRRVATLAAELDLPVHAPLGEAAALERFDRLGLLGPGLAVPGAEGLVARDIEQLARHGCSIVHCPSSDLALARGFAPIAAIVRAGINLALGSGAAEANPRLDLLQEMRTASLVARAQARDPAALPAQALLRAATLGGARALGLEDRIGSIAPGKQADLVAIEMRDPGLAAPGEPLKELVLALGRERVSQVWVSGHLALARD